MIVTEADKALAGQTECLHSEGLGHDCAYVDARNRLLVAAERLTVAQTQRNAPDVDDPHVMAWGAAFLRNVQALWEATEDI